MRSICQAGNGQVARDVMWLQRGMRLGRGLFYAASTTNAYATVRGVAEERDPALEPSTVSSYDLYFLSRGGGVISHKIHP